MRVRVNRCEIPLVTVAEYIGLEQVERTWKVFLAWPPDELTPEQQQLDRLMRQVPRPGRGGGHAW